MTNHQTGKATEMAPKWIEALTGSLEQKKRYREYQGRIRALPEPYASTARAVNRYLMHTGAVLDGDTWVTMFSDLADLWEQAVADGLPVRDVVGEDPVEFTEAFAQAYSGKRWIDKERERLERSVDEAVHDAPARGDR